MKHLWTGHIKTFLLKYLCIFIIYFSFFFPSPSHLSAQYLPHIRIHLTLNMQPETGKWLGTFEGVKRRCGLCGILSIHQTPVWGVRVDPKPCQHPHIKTSIQFPQEKPSGSWRWPLYTAVNLSGILDPSLPAPDPGQWAPVTSEPQI